MTHGALGPNGLALCGDGEESLGVATVFYQMFESLGRADWQREFPQNESPVTLAVGSHFVAVSTTANYVRIFSEAGMQSAVISLAAPCVALVGQSSFLTAVYHNGLPFAGNANLSYTMWNVAQKRTLIEKADLPISHESRLEWIGYSEDDVRALNFILFFNSQFFYSLLLIAQNLFCEFGD